MPPGPFEDHMTQIMGESARGLWVPSVSLYLLSQSIAKPRHVLPSPAPTQRHRLRVLRLSINKGWPGSAPRHRPRRFPSSARQAVLGSLEGNEGSQPRRPRRCVRRITITGIALHHSRRRSASRPCVRKSLLLPASFPARAFTFTAPCPFSHSISAVLSLSTVSNFATTFPTLQRPCAGATTGSRAWFPAFGSWSVT